MRALAIAALAALALTLAGANLTQAPRLRSADANPDLAVSRHAQRLVLHLNQPVEPVGAAAVSVAPETPVEADSDGAAVTVRFDQLLDYATEYRIAAEVTSAATGTRGTVETSFTTPDPDVFTLVGSELGARPDRVVRQPLVGAGEPRTVFEAAGIREYAVLERGIAAIVVHDDERGGGVELSLPADVGGAALPLLGFDALEQLRGDSAGEVAGVLASGIDETGEEFERALVLFDIDARTVSAASGALGHLIPVEDWRFVPGTRSVVLRSDAGGLMLFETWPEERLLDLGVSGEITGFLPGTAVLAVESDGAESDGAESEGAELLLDLSAATVGGLDASAPEVPAAGAPQLERRDAADAFARAIRDAAPGEVVRVCASPNAEYLAVEVAPPPGGAATTRFVRVADGREARTVDGGLSDWCA